MKLTQSICVNCATTKGLFGKANSGMERTLSSEKLTVVGYGRFLGVNNFYAACGNTSLSKEYGQNRYWRMPRRTSTKEYKVTSLQRSPGTVKECSDTDCDAHMMRRACYAGKSGNWEGFKEEFRKKAKFSEWACARLKEAYEKVASEDVGRLSIAQDTLREH